VAFVLDASVSACWALADEGHPIADVALTRSQTEEIYAPTLWWFEIRSLLVVAERRKRLTAPRTDAFLRSLPTLRLLFDQSPDEREIIALARRQALTVYDASYLALAIRLRLPLATLDKKLAAAANREGADLVG
jgi:predicted nucleic acid-binding protein